MFLQPLQSGEAEKFIGCKTGLGLFVTQAGENRICMHQAANDGINKCPKPTFVCGFAALGFVITFFLSTEMFDL